MYEQEKRVAERFFEEVWNQGRIELLPELTVPGTIHDPLLGEIEGAQGTELFVTGFRTAFPDLRFKIEHIVAEAPFVTVHWTVTGTHTGPLMSIQATGKYGAIAGMTLLRFEGAKIAESWVARDDLKMFQLMDMAQTIELVAVP
jgi:predicted ester cyclase